jgi:hypothetical protein
MIDIVLESTLLVHGLEPSSLVTTVNFDFATAAVVSFVIVILGLAAGLLLMIRFANQQAQKEGQ